jgi:DNA-directed RNA polymerase I, II, and III subunit RPABC2
MSDLEDSDIEDTEKDEPEDTEKDELEDTEKDGSEKGVFEPTIPTRKLQHIESDNDDDDDDLDTDDDLSPDEYTASLEGQTSNKSITDLGSVQKIDDTSQLSPINSDVESEDDDYLKKFNIDNRDNYVNEFHPECFTGNSTDIESLTKIVRDANNVIIDNNHRTNPFLTKYEKAKVLGQRAKQLNYGAKPYISVPANIIEGYLIAQLELKEKKLPIIIRRPLPGGNSEYWKLIDLEEI